MVQIKYNSQTPACKHKQRCGWLGPFKKTLLLTIYFKYEVSFSMKWLKTLQQLALLINNVCNRNIMKLNHKRFFQQASSDFNVSFLMCKWLNSILKEKQTLVFFFRLQVSRSIWVQISCQSTSWKHNWNWHCPMLGGPFFQETRKKTSETTVFESES